MGRLTVLKQIARDLAFQFGPECEIVIHDLKTNDPEHSIVHIENGHVTGRGIGDGPSNAVFDVIRHNNKKKKPEQEESEDKQSFIEAGRFQNLTDGIYTGSADAFRGDVEVQVTVEKQKVTDISILSYCDTEEYFFRAAPAVIEQMKAEQSLNVDAVSGATYSSNGIIHAVANALEIPEDQYAPRPGRNLTAKKKNHGHIVKHEITSQEEYEEKVEKYSK